MEPPGFSLVDEAGDVLALDQLEAEAIRFALTHYRGRMSMIARKLGIGRSTLYRKLKGLPLAVNVTAAEVEAKDGLDNKSQHVAA
jgi:DNA-binding NtrC family response regulator